MVAPMGLLDRLKGSAAGAGNALKTAAKAQARAAIVPQLITKKSLELAGVDQELGKLSKHGWSADASVKARRGELTSQKTALTLELNALKLENQGNVDAARKAQSSMLSNLR